MSMASDNTQREVQIAYENNKKIIILRLDNSEIPNEFKYALAGKQWTNYSSRKWKSEIVSALGGGKKFFRTPKPSPILPVQSTRSLPKKPPKPQLILAQLEYAFSANGAYYKDQCDAAISKLDNLLLIAGSHWINPAFAYNELVPRVYFLEKIELIKSLMQDFQDTCPPGSSAKRQLIHNELQTLSQELSRKTNK